ncbi:hypothetical protein [Dactylosporangium cerinum]
MQADPGGVLLTVPADRQCPLWTEEARTGQVSPAAIGMCSDWRSTSRSGTPASIARCGGSTGQGLCRSSFSGFFAVAVRSGWVAASSRAPRSRARAVAMSPATGGVPCGRLASTHDCRSRCVGKPVSSGNALRGESTQRNAGARRCSRR